MKRRYAAYGIFLLLAIMIIAMCHSPTGPSGGCGNDSLSTTKCPPPKQK